MFYLSEFQTLEKIVSACDSDLGITTTSVLKTHWEQLSFKVETIVLCVTHPHPSPQPTHQLDNYFPGATDSVQTIKYRCIIIR